MGTELDWNLCGKASKKKEYSKLIAELWGRRENSAIRKVKKRNILAGAQNASKYILKKVKIVRKSKWNGKI